MNLITQVALCYRNPSIKKFWPKSIIIVLQPYNCSSEQFHKNDLENFYSKALKADQ